MASPFHEELSQQTYGDYVYEWRSLLNTPCFGFSGPNACYSTTCDHNSSLWEPEKQLTKQKIPNSSKMSYKFFMNAKKLWSNCERATDHTTYKSSFAADLSVQTNAYGYIGQERTYDQYEPKFNGDIYYDGEMSGSRLLYDDSALVESRDFTQLSELSDYYCSSATSNYPNVQQIQPVADSNGEETLASSSREIVVSAKKYTFNPLSEPFHPTQNIYTKMNATASVTTNSLECSSIVPTVTTTYASATTNPIRIERIQTEEKFVCILCPEKYNTLAELKEHLKNKVHQPYDCVICGVSFEHNYLLRRHMNQHRSLKEFRCRSCNKKFRSLNQLGKHFEYCRYKLYMFI